MQIHIPMKGSDNAEMRNLIDTQIRYLLPKKSQVEFDSDGISILCDHELPASLIDDLREFVHKTEMSYRKVSVMQSKKVEHNSTFNQDPMPFLVSSKQVFQATPGIFYYAGELLELMQALDDYFKRFALSMGASERLYPNVLPLDSMMENGYMSGFPHHALFISMAHQDTATLERVSGCKELSELENLIAPNGLMLAPTVCHHCFEELKQSNIEDNLILTSTGKCHRFEGPSAEDLSRTHIFNMREIVLFGKPAWVHKNRLMIKSESEKILTRWNMDYAVETATDPFFPAGSQKKRNFQAMNQTKFEIKLSLPYKQQAISAVSVNNHMDTLVQSYNITGEKGLISSCVGFGLERLAFAILCQHGLDRTLWPESMLQDLGLASE